MDRVRQVAAGRGRGPGGGGQRLLVGPRLPEGRQRVGGLARVRREVRPAATGSPPAPPAPPGRCPPGRASSDSDRRYVASASPVFPVASSSPATSVRLRPTSTVAAASAPGSAASASRAASTARCAFSASSLPPTLPVRSASSKFDAASARRDGRVGLPTQQRRQLAVEVLGRPQQPVAQLLELVLLQQEVLADAGVERLDRLDRQVVPRLHRRLRAGQLVVGGGQRPVGVPLPGQRPGDLGLGLRLHRQHRREPHHPREQRHGHRRHRRPVPIRPAADAPRERLAPGRDRLVGHPPLDVLGQRPATGIAIRRLRRHRLQADRFQGLVQRRDRPPRGARTSPACTRRRISPMSSPSNGGRPVNRQYSVAPSE